MTVRKYRVWKKTKGDLHNFSDYPGWVVREFWNTNPSEYQEDLSSRRALYVGIVGFFYGVLAALITYLILDSLVRGGLWP